MVLWFLYLLKTQKALKLVTVCKSDVINKSNIQIKWSFHLLWGDIMLQQKIKNVSIISLAHLQIHLQYTNQKNLLYIQKISQLVHVPGACTIVMYWLQPQWDHTCCCPSVGRYCSHWEALSHRSNKTVAWPDPASEPHSLLGSSSSSVRSIFS